MEKTRQVIARLAALCEEHDAEDVAADADPKTVRQQQRHIRTIMVWLDLYSRNLWAYHEKKFP